MNTQQQAIKALQDLGLALGASIEAVANRHPETRSSDPVFPIELARKLVRAGKHSLLRDLARLVETGASLPAGLLVEVAEFKECTGEILDLFSSRQGREWRPAANSTGRLRDNSTELNFGENSSMLSSVEFVLDDHAPGHGSRPSVEVTDSGVASALQSLQSAVAAVPAVAAASVPAVAAAAVPAVAASVLDGPSTSAAAAASVLGGSSSDPFSTTTSTDPNVRRELEELKQMYHRGTDRKVVYTRLRGLYGRITFPPVQYRDCPLCRKKKTRNHYCADRCRYACFCGYLSPSLGFMNRHDVQLHKGHKQQEKVRRIQKPKPMVNTTGASLHATIGGVNDTKDL